MKLQLLKRITIITPLTEDLVRKHDVNAKEIELHIDDGRKQKKHLVFLVYAGRILVHLV